MTGRRSFRTITVLVMLLTALTGVGQPLPVAGVSFAQPVTPVAAEPLEATTETAVDFPSGIELTGLLNLTRLVVDNSGSVDLLYRIGAEETLHLVMAMKEGGSTDAAVRVNARIDLQSNFVPAGVELSFFWRVPLDGGGYAESDRTVVQWFDNRWNWQQISSSQVRLRFFDLDPAFAGRILDSAQSTVTDLERRFALERSDPISVWIYPSAEAFRGAQQPNSREAVAGASYPGFLLITAIIPDGSDREIGRVIPHEVSHQILYQATRNPFTLPPLWFDEGIATHYQIGGTDGFLEMVIRAEEQGELFDLGSLDVSFPYSPEQAALAYATSWSAIAYIREVHGDEGIAAMIRAFGTGAPYPVAIEQALGLSKEELNREWRSWVARQRSSIALGAAG